MFELVLSGQMFDSLSVWEHLSAASDFGYRGVELRSTHISPSTSPETRHAVRALLREKNLTVNCLSCFTGNYGLLDEDGCADAFKTFKQYLVLAQELDAKLIRVWPAWVESAAATDEVFERAALWVRRSAQEAAATGCRVAMEMHHGTLLDSADSALRLLRLIDREDVGLILDPVNLYQAGDEPIGTCIRKLGGRIFDVHVKDVIKLASPAHKGCFRYDYYAKHIGRFTKVVPPRTYRDDCYAHRRIGMGGVDWPSALDALREIGYCGMLAVESVSESDAYMPTGRALAAACMRDARSLLKATPSLPGWHVVSPGTPGLHEVISPDRSPCRSAHILRLNLRPGEAYTLCSGTLEMNALLVRGAADICGCQLNESMTKLDSFYIPGGSTLCVTAGLEGADFYIGAGLCEGIGAPFFRRCDLSLPFGRVHQIHGEGSGQREVFFTLDEAMPASRLICGITWGADGMWTSWPPHQHEIQLEEVYCYFDMTMPGLQLSYGTDECFIDPRVSVVRDGHMVMAPNGYHPTVATPGVRNTYFWVLVAHSPKTRGYNYARTDPAFAETI